VVRPCEPDLRSVTTGCSARRFRVRAAPNTLEVGAQTSIDGEVSSSAPSGRDALLEIGWLEERACFRFSPA
jgi:hypothetical protein